MSQANVRSTDALKDLRAALGVFAEESMAALGAVEMEIRRTTRWLQDEQGAYWEGQIKRRREQVAMARAELSRKKMGKMFGHGSTHSEQKDLVEEAEKKLRAAEIRLQRVKKWIPVLQQAILEYHSTTRRLEGLVSGDIPRAMAQLDRVIDSIEAYLSVAPPSGAAAIGAGADTGFRSAARAGTVSPAEPSTGEPTAAPAGVEEEAPVEPPDPEPAASGPAPTPTEEA